MSRSDLLFLAVLATVPVQLNKFFFPYYSYVLGIPIDYLALSVYFSDITIVIFLAAFVIEKKKNLAQIDQKHRSFLIVFGLFALYLFLSSANSLASPVFATRILLFGSLAFFAAHVFSQKKMKKPIILVLSASVLWQSILIIGQFVRQESLGLWILGERSFDSATIGIAHAQIAGFQLLRPYGTFPHPNVAAAFLTIFLLSLLGHNGLSRQSKILIWVISVVAIFLTFSQAALLVLAIAAIILTRPLRTRLVISLLVITLLGIFAKLVLAGQIASIAERLTLAQAAFDITAKNPIFGVGANNFIPQLAKLDLYSIAEIRLLQPVHNIFLLILAENGLIGLLLFVALLAAVAANIRGKTKIALFAALLVFGSLDHFLWTLHQGQMVFWLSTGYILSEQK